MDDPVLLLLVYVSVYVSARIWFALLLSAFGWPGV